MNTALLSLTTRQGTHRVPWRTLGLTFFISVLYLFGSTAVHALQIDKFAIAQGELWRVLYGHFVHYTFDHFFWDAVALLILGSVIERNNPRDLFPSLLLSCAGVSAWFIFGDSQWSSYSGLSGALNGLLVVAAVNLWRQTQNRTFLIVIVLTLLKTLYEFLTHKTFFTSIDAQAVPEAHLVGMLAGGIYIGMIFLNRLKNKY